MTVIEKIWTASTRNGIKDSTMFHDEKKAKCFYKQRANFYDNSELWSFSSDEDAVRTYNSSDGKKVSWLVAQEC